MKRKIIIISSIVLFILLSGTFLFKLLKNNYFPIEGEDSKYYWLFKDSIIKDLRLVYSFGNKKDTLFSYEYKGDYKFTIWEIGAFSKVDNSKITISQNVTLGKFNLNPYSEVVFVPFILNSNLNLSAKNLVFNFDKRCKLIKNEFIGSQRYILINLNEVDIRNEKKECQIRIIKNEGPNEVSMIIYQTKNWYLLLINSLKNNKINLNSFLK